jgi:hypothetical protein
VSFEQFYSWVRDHPDATIICQWLLTETSTLSLSNDLDTPTFYQTLAGVTHCEYSKIDMCALENTLVLLTHFLPARCKNSRVYFCFYHQIGKEGNW